MKKIIAIVVAFVVVIGGVIGFGMMKKTGNKTANIVKIGGVFDTSGNVSAYGQAEQKGANFAVKRINAAGGVKVNGKTYKFKMVNKDSKSDNTEAASVTTNLINNNQVNAIVGPVVTSAVQAAIPSATKGKTPVISPTAGADSITVQKNGAVQPYIFRAQFKNSYLGTKMAQFATDTIKARNVIVFQDNSSDYGTGITAAFKKAYTGNIVETDSYQAGDTDFQAILTKIKNKKFDAIIINGYYTEAGAILKQARDMGIEVPVIGPDGLGDPKLAEIAGNKNTSNVYYAAHFSTKALSTDAAKAFVKSYRKDYQQEPSQFTALSYDAVYMIKQAIEDEKSIDKAKITDGLAKIKNFEGTTGKMTMDKFHNPKKSIVMVGVQNGKDSTATVVK
ncbi:MULTISPECIES: ABC transporter substrate-binding protein [Leuconostoc]|uniref:ABC transporter substrate-binding protein n=1 Tax=Leuconostoc kimchii TaxID=136609 RepID=A0ABX5SLE9_9LACO|nr:MULTISPECIES: ABC transporter substrate-binding protein [Leuconostoc]AEJ30202.1 putative ABC transporter, branched chain amino acid-binding protein [Leuconostoc sp. C2]QBR47287.1 ABC transporter substrate-binding protein [Leuconostoc kimchii]